MIYQVVLLFTLYQSLIGQKPMISNSRYTVSTKTMNNTSICNRTINANSIIFTCPTSPPRNHLEIDDLNSTFIEFVETLVVDGLNGQRGPLTNIPSNICRFINLKNLQLGYNQIQNSDFNSSLSCLLYLQSLDLESNFLTEFYINWINSMFALTYLNLGYNHLTCPPYIAYGIDPSDTLYLLIHSNNLRAIELGVLQVTNYTDYSSNPVERFSNYYNVDLSHAEFASVASKLNAFYPNINFDDTVYEMYNRCDEVNDIFNFNTTNVLGLTFAILYVIGYPVQFYDTCTCDRYYFYRTAYVINGYHFNDSFFNWTCPGDTLLFVNKCNYRSSANFTNVIPRLCKIDPSESGQIPIYADPDLCEIENNPTTSTQPTLSTTLPTASSTTSSTISTPTPPIHILANETVTQLENIDVLDSSTADKFAQIINEAHTNLNTTNDQDITPETQKNFQQAIYLVESLIESVNTSINISNASVAVFSMTKSNSLNYLAQFILNSSQIYSSEPNNSNNSIASITIDRTYIDELSNDDIYSLFILPSSMFHYAQEDRSINIISPIIGAHLPNEQLLIINMSFIDDNIDPSSGTYSCAFWELDHWNNSGCIYSQDPHTRRHHCVCNHLTSFALIFTPNGTLSQTFIPSAIAAILSIIGLFLSICLSIYEQTTSRAAQTSRYFPLTNIFSLSNTLILFILLTIILFSKQQTLINTTQCQTSSLNLALATYSFVILTFASKTLLGIYYFLTIFIHFALIQWTAMPSKWFIVTLVITILCALIPTIILARQWSDVLVQYENICWFSNTYLIKFVTIPISIFVGINIIIIIFIVFRLFQFVFYKTVTKQSEDKRLIIAICIWITSCVLLGVAWITGPLLGIFVDENGKTNSRIGQTIQWIFALLIGLEGVWVLIVNILFYLNRRPKREHRSINSLGQKRPLFTIDEPGGNWMTTKRHYNEW